MSWSCSRAACLWLLFALPARAQPAVPEAETQREAASATLEVPARDPDQLLHEALAAYAAEDLPRARALFEEVHRSRPSARTLRALGVLAFRESRFSEAVNLLEQSLASQVKPLTEELARGASELLGQARVLARAEVAPAQPPAPEPLPTLEPPASKPAPAPSTTVTPARQRPDLRTLRRTSYALYALAGAGVVVAVVGTALGMKRLDGIESRCRESTQGSCTPERANQLAHREKLRVLSGLSIGGTVLASLSGATAVTLSLWLRGRDDASAPGPLQGLSLQVRGRF